MPRLKEELGEELCNYCPLEESHRGVSSHGGEPSFCFEGGSCDEAYINYLEEVGEGE